MSKRFFAPAAFVLAAVMFFIFFLHRDVPGKPVPPAGLSAVSTVLLIPLDSRPPCKQLVEDNAKTDNIKILTPPSEILDYYYNAGDTRGVANWLKDNIKNADAAVISIDQLLHGGLIASREGKKTERDNQQLIKLLEEVHRLKPAVPLYAFNILPRITPPPSIGGYSLWKDFIEYSRLTDRLAIKYDAEEAARLETLRNELPQEDLRRYHALFDNNFLMNKALAGLVKKGVLTMLVIGQDDGEEYGIPNLKKRELQKYLHQEKLTADKVFITHGADEIALSILARISALRHNYTPKICPEYNDPSTPGFIMPFMAGSVADTTAEKLRLLNAVPVASPQEADFTLFISCTDKFTLASRRQSAEHVKKLLADDCQVALVDLSEGFLAEETVFPFLIKNETPLHQLTAYAGWNTASNSIGTAVSQAVIFNAVKKDARNKEAVTELYRQNLTLLANRYLEDYCYLKDITDQVNFHLIKAGYTNVGDLDLEHNYRFANAMLQDSVNERLQRLSATKAFRAPVRIKAQGAEFRLRVKKLTVDTCFPWPRTFEIYLRTAPQLEELSQ